MMYSKKNRLPLCGGRRSIFSVIIYTSTYPPCWWLIMTMTITTSVIAQFNWGTMWFTFILSLLIHIREVFVFT